MSEDSAEAIHLDNASRAVGIGNKDHISEEDRLWLKDKMEAMSGVRDLEEANRRMDVVWEWRLENRGGKRDRRITRTN